MSEKTYIRFELHEQMENKNWRRVTTSKSQDLESARAEMLRNYSTIYSNDVSSQILGISHKHGLLRIARCTVEVLCEVPNPLRK